jgi:hypothetical protein
MSSTTSSPAGFFSSPRNQRWLMWISSAVLVVGVAVFLGVYLSRGTSQPTNAKLATIASPKPSTTPAAKKNPPVAPSTDALKVARTFLETAVLRKNLAAAYALVGPNLKGGLSLAQWRTGNIPVQPFPSSNAKTARLIIESSHKNALLLGVVLAPLHGPKSQAVAFYLGLDRVGQKWLVNYWLPLPSGKHLPTPN